MFGRKPVIIVYPENASPREIFAAREIRRYIYLRSGELLELIPYNPEVPKNHDLIFVGQKKHPEIKRLAEDFNLGSLLQIIKSGHPLLKTVEEEKRRILLITSGDDIGTLYAAYRFAEHLGIRFYLHGDVIPDGRIPFSLPNITEDFTPLFAIRGIQPFHDFPEGPDWWNADDYKAILSQLPKLGMNFFGLHTYPESSVGPEPATWIGLSEDCDENGEVTFSYPSHWFNTILGTWGYAPKKTGDYLSGAGMMYDRDDYGSEVMRGHAPVPQTPEDCNEVFNRAGEVLGESFEWAHTLGITTCLGTETPLTVPAPLRERLTSKGMNPEHDTVKQQLYEGMFNRIKKTYGLDYYWFWTPENWTWGGNTASELDATKNDLSAAMKAAESVDVPFTLATCGWVLGPQNDRAMFDSILPKTMPMSCINRRVGWSPVDPAFEKIRNRPKWAIPWLEDDPNLIIPQLWAGRMRADAADALNYGCTGLIGIHWRTRILGPNISALAKAAWSHEPFGEKPFAPGAEEGIISTYDGVSIAGTTDDVLYQTVRTDISAYRLAVPNGEYTVTLKFCENEFDRAGMRIFNADIQNIPILRNLDIYAQAGKNTAFDHSVDTIKVDDGQLVITFIRQLDYPVLAALEVRNDSFSTKINIGGPEYGDYQADELRARTRGPMIDDFYDDWAFAQFGPESAQEISELFQELDGQLPVTTQWIDGPGSLYPDTRPWEEIAPEYDFVNTFAVFRSAVQGAGNLERFDYWLNNFTYMRSVAQLNCAWGQFDRAMKTLDTETDPQKKSELAEKTALPAFREMVDHTETVYRYLLATVSTTGEMGMVTNFESHNLPRLLEETGNKLSEIMGKPLPEDAIPSKEYNGEPRVIVPTVRTCVEEGEVIILKVIVLDKTPSAKTELCWRPMGAEAYTVESAENVNRGVYSVSFPSGGVSDDIEYYVKVTTSAGRELVYPATAPDMNQTVVVISR